MRLLANMMLVAGLTLGGQATLAAGLPMGGQAKEEKQVKCPVCGMTVDPKTAEKSAYKGQTYYFCSKAEKQEFDKSPDKYVKPAKKK